MNANADSDQRISHRGAVIPHLKGRMRVNQVEAIVAQSSEPEGLAESAGAGSKLSDRSAWRQASIDGHLAGARQRFKRTQEQATRLALDFAGNIRAEITAIDRVNICVTGGAKKDAVTWSGAAMGVSGRVGRVVVRAQVGFDFDDPPCQHAGVRSMRENLAQQARGYMLRRSLKESAGEQAARKARCSHVRLDKPPELLQKPLCCQMIVVPISPLKVLLCHLD